MIFRYGFRLNREGPLLVNKPPETGILVALSLLQSQSRTLPTGMAKSRPVVALGAVGTKTVVIFRPLPA